MPLVFLLVRDAGDAAMAALCVSLGALATAMLTLWQARAIGLLRRPCFHVPAAWRQLKAGAHVFGSTAAISLYTNTLSVGLGMIAGAGQLGLFAMAERIRRSAQGALSPILTVFFPRISALHASDPAAAGRLARRLLLTQGGLAAALALLLPFGLKRAFTSAILAGGAAGLMLLWPLASRYGATGAAWTAVAAEVVVAASMGWAAVREFGGRARRISARVGEQAS